MRDRPAGVSDAEVLAAVRSAWQPTASDAVHLPLGSGAHHWRATDSDGRRLFVTWDALADGRTLQGLDAAYRSAGELARTLPFVHSGLTPWTLPFHDGGLSATPWRDGRTPDELDRLTTRLMLRDLAAASPPDRTPRWQPLPSQFLADELTAALVEPWSTGPFGARARSAIRSHLGDIDGWIDEYRRLARLAVDHPAVLTHGEPGIHNQLLTADGPVLVDWESLALAPAERDLRTLGEGDERMLRLFDLEWRLSEIREYARRFADPHGDGADDREAFDDLLEELDRP